MAQGSRATLSLSSLLYFSFSPYSVVVVGFSSCHSQLQLSTYVLNQTVFRLLVQRLPFHSHVLALSLIQHHVLSLDPLGRPVPSVLSRSCVDSNPTGTSSRCSQSLLEYMAAKCQRRSLGPLAYVLDRATSTKLLSTTSRWLVLTSFSWASPS